MEEVKRKEIEIFTDGACQGNPGPGGCGIVLKYGVHRKELAFGYTHTTNNRMELLAAIHGLEALKASCIVHLVSDSRYVVDAMNKGWVQRWERNNWMRNKGQKASNADLWERLLQACAEHTVYFHWIKGHAGHPENERCDALAVEAAQQPEHLEDTGYTSSLFTAQKALFSTPPQEPQTSVQDIKR